MNTPIEVHRAYYYDTNFIYDFSSYVPPLSANAVDLSSTDKMISFRLANYIYFFKLDDQGSKLSRLNACYYQYDILLNAWESLEFSEASLSAVASDFNKVSVVTQGKQAYLLFFRIKGNVKLSIIRITNY